MPLSEHITYFAHFVFDISRISQEYTRTDTECFFLKSLVGIYHWWMYSYINNLLESCGLPFVGELVCNLSDSLSWFVMASPSTFPSTDSTSTENDMSSLASFSSLSSSFSLAECESLASLTFSSTFSPFVGSEVPDAEVSPTVLGLTVLCFLRNFALLFLNQTYKHNKNSYTN